METELLHDFWGIFLHEGKQGDIFLHEGKQAR